MTDRELLESAAKAAGMDDAEYQDGGDWMEVRYGFREAIWSETHGNYWNPLTEDSDALRLAVKLNLDMTRMQAGISWDDPDRYAATRRAIVRAATEIAHGHNGSPASKVTRPDEQDAPGSSIGLGAEGEQ